MLSGLAVVLLMMALVALAETLAPFHARGERRTSNLLLTGVTLASNLVLALGGTLLSESLRAHGLGLFSGRQLAAVTTFAIAVVALDFSTYMAHWSMHRLPALWRVHRVHHSDRLVDVTTALRQHPVETLIRFLFVMITAWALGLPVAAVAAYRLISAINALFEHANVRVWQPLDSLLSLALVTPNMHKVHHSRRQPETDSNYGNILSLFDRLFGTFTATARVTGVVYGLETRTEDA